MNSPIAGVDLDGLEFYYASDGTFIGKFGNSTKVRVVDQSIIDATAKISFSISQGFSNVNSGKAKDPDGFMRQINKFSTEIKWDYNTLIKTASIAYGESSRAWGIVDYKEMNAIANVNSRHPENDAYALQYPAAKTFNKTNDENRNLSTDMKMAISATIGAAQGVDYSNEATNWDGREQGMMDGTKAKVGRWKSHAYTQGWRISDEHYKSWKEIINEKEGSGSFKAPQVSIGKISYNRGKIRNTSVAQFGLTIFWQQKRAEDKASTPTSEDSTKLTK